jgi:predicted dehydrogenase
MSRVRLAVVGAGLIGHRHAEHIAAEPRAILSAIVDPSPTGRAVAERFGARWFPDLAGLLAADRPEGLIIATPNQLHVAHGLEAIAAGIPAIIEKPVADSVAEGHRLVAAAEVAGVPLLVGHHRRYNPMIAKAREIVTSGRLGTILTLNAQFWLLKPETYFAPDWRRRKGAGPIFLNLIHDIDLLRYLCGPVVSVQAQQSNAMRGNEVEETAVILLRFASGALGTVSVSDRVVAPWSWEMTAGENPDYVRQDQSCYQIGGTHGALTIPTLEVWTHKGERDWWQPMLRERIAFTPDNPLKRQIAHFCEVIRDGAEPIMSAREGLETLKVVEAIKQAAETGASIRLD